MVWLKRFFFLFLTVVFFTSFSLAADINYPYGNINLKLPPDEDPYPVLGGFSTIDRGMQNALVNPATLGKLKLSEVHFAAATPPSAPAAQRITKVNELSGTFEVGAGVGGAKAPARYGLFFRYPSQIGSGIITKEVEIASTVNYQPAKGNQDFTAAQRLNDWLVVGFASRSPLSGGLDLAGVFPVTSRMDMNMYGQSLGNMRVSNEGRFQYTFNTGGTITTAETSTAVWNGFLSQEATIPFLSQSQFQDNVNLQAPYVGTIASSFGKFYAGFNFMPVSANAQIDNDVAITVSSDTSDPFLYVPDFDPDNVADGLAWLSDPARYGTSTGFSRKRIDLPEGEVVGNTRYRGYYNASTMRLDLGTLYDVSDWCSVSFALENIGGAALDMKGTGLSYYATYRQVNTQEVNDLFDPGADSTWAPFTDTWITTYEVDKTKLYMEPEKNYPLPKKTRLGIVFRKPFLIALDYEMNSTPVKYVTTQNNTTTDITISNINYFRLGVESRVFALPWWMTGSITFLPKPSITGLTTEAQTKVDDAYARINKYMLPGFPTKMDLGTYFNAWETYFGGTFCLNPGMLLQVAQLDLTGSDMSRLVGSTFFISRDAWQLSYVTQLDPTATAANYNNKPVPAGGQKSFEFTDIKYIQTIGVTYRF
jgi:hypothetical protein